MTSANAVAWLATQAQSAADIPALPPGVRLTQLENGLTLILHEDHCAPVVSAQAWCQAGSIHEGKWLGAGASHVLEHMLFKGTTRRGPSRIDQEIQDAGGYMNAYTSFDRTVFHISVPNTGAAVAVDVLCDIMQHATLPAEELVKEKQVILREMDMNQDDPNRRASRRLFETAFVARPYRYPIIGSPDIFHELQREDLLAYYREQYAPNNVVFVVVGDFSIETIERQIREAYAGAKSRPLPPVVLPEEPKQTAQREVIEEAPIELGYLHYAWHIPGVRHPDVPLLDVLATLLGSGRSSRLFQEVREKTGLVQSVEAWTYNPGQAGLLGVSAVLEPARFEPACQAMLAEVERMRAELVAPEELAKAVKQFIAGTLATRKTMQGQAQDLGSSWLAARDLNFSQRYLAAVKQITPEALRRVAREYLSSENRTLYALLPTGTAPQIRWIPEVAADRPIQKFDLASGLRLLVKEDHRLPFVEFRVLFQGGLLAENSANNGLTLLLARMLLKGTATRSAEQIAREIESVGGSLDSYSGQNSFGIAAEVLSADLAMGLELVVDVMRHPAFSEPALELERQMQLAGIRAQRDQVLQSGSRALRQALFGDHGYGLDINGSESSVAALTTADLRAFHRALVTPNNCVLAVYGDVEAEAVRSAIAQALNDWAPGGPVLAGVTDPPPLTEVRRAVEFRDKKQAVLLIGYRGITMFNPDRFALELLQEACSDLGSRLFLRIREKLGLAYFVGAQNFLGLMGGYFAFYVGTTPEKAALVETEILHEVDLLRQDGLTAEELQRAKAKVIGQKKIARQDLGALAMTTALDELFGLGYANTDAEDAALEAVTLEQVQAAAQRYLTPEALAIAVVRPPE